MAVSAGTGGGGDRNSPANPMSPRHPLVSPQGEGPQREAQPATSPAAKKKKRVLCNIANLSVPQFPHLHIGYNNRPSTIRFGGLNKLNTYKVLRTVPDT